MRENHQKTDFRQTMQYKVKIHILELERGDYHTLVNGSVAGHRIRIVLDTGASHSCMDQGFARQILPALQTAQHEGVTAGIGGDDFEVQIADVPDFRIGRFHLPFYPNMALIDFTYINQAYHRLRKKPLQMILGNDFFVKNHAVINYEEGLLYFTVDKKKK